MSEHDDPTPSPAGEAPKAPRKRAARKKAAPRKRAAKKAPDAEARHVDPSTDANASDGPSATAPRADATATPSRGDTRAPTRLHRCAMPVRWRDLDAFNHVNNAQYLGYLEEARLQWMMGLPGMGLDDDVAPVIAAVQLNYRRPITWPARVDIELFVERLGTTSVAIGHRIVDSGDDDTLYCDGHVVMVWIDRASGQPTALPQGVREACSD